MLGELTMAQKLKLTLIEACLWIACTLIGSAAGIGIVAVVGAVIA